MIELSVVPILDFLVSVPNTVAHKMSEYLTKLVIDEDPFNAGIYINGKQLLKEISITAT